MKTQHTNLLNKLNVTELSELTEVTKETIATEIKNHSKVFSCADLWNIQRSAKARVLRRHLA
ncbi:MAG: hypothetical protein JSR09_05300 [Bacteroidetes bacterium]|nr:hypothetical protein [Bacteroidota bacterium]MBS1649103.1 hypothetical protein [Bacteroidota bacterium]